MRRNPPTTSRGRALTALRARCSLTLALLLLAAGPVAAAAPPPPSSVAPWSARCYTDTCVGFSVLFESGHAVAIGHAGDSPNLWAIRASSDLTADEATFAVATVSALERRDLPALAAAYPELPVWYMDSLATYVVPDHPVYRVWWR